MDKFLAFVIKWWRKYSLIRFKTILFSLLCTSVLLNQNFTLDLKNFMFSYANGDISELTILTAAITSIIFVGYDFFINKAVVKQRENDKLFELLQNPDVEKHIKEEIIEIIRGRY